MVGCATVAVSRNVEFCRGFKTRRSSCQRCAIPLQQNLDSAEQANSSSASGICGINARAKLLRGKGAEWTSNPPVAATHHNVQRCCAPPQQRGVARNTFMRSRLPAVSCLRCLRPVLHSVRRMRRGSRAKLCAARTRARKLFTTSSTPCAAHSQPHSRARLHIELAETQVHTLFWVPRRAKPAARQSAAVTHLGSGEEGDVLFCYVETRAAGRW